MRKWRKEVKFWFEGVAKDLSFIFYADFLNDVAKNERVKTRFKVSNYEDGIMEMQFKHQETIPRVAFVVSRIFRKESAFCNLDFVILNYRNVKLKIGHNTGRKNIIHMLEKSMKKADATKKEIDMETCWKERPAKEVISRTDEETELVLRNLYEIKRIDGISKQMYFESAKGNKVIKISSIKNGKVSMEVDIDNEDILDLQNDIINIFAMPDARFYGLTKFNLRVNYFQMEVDKENFYKFLNYYVKSKFIIEELENRKQKGEIRKNLRRKNVITKIMKDENFELEFASDYILFWKELTIYLMEKHNKVFDKAWRYAAKFTGIDMLTALIYVGAGVFEKELRIL